MKRPDSIDSATCLILGYGNPLCSDDGIGCKAATALEAELTSASVSFVVSHQLTPELAESVARVSRVLFLDASHAGAHGEIRYERIYRDRTFQPGTWTHSFEPTALLELAARYFHSEPEAWLLTLTGENFDLGEAFSTPVQRAWNDYLNRIRAWADCV